MRKHIVFFSSLFSAVALALVLAWAVGAQGPEPGEHRPHSGPHPIHPMEVRLDEKPAPQPAPSGGLGAQGVSAAMALGQPGLSFRYVDTFGVTEAAWLADSDHLYHPNGLGLDGADNLWIAETDGFRRSWFRRHRGSGQEMCPRADDVVHCPTDTAGRVADVVPNDRHNLHPSRAKCRETIHPSTSIAIY